MPDKLPVIEKRRNLSNDKRDQKKENSNTKFILHRRNVSENKSKQTGFTPLFPTTEKSAVMPYSVVAGSQSRWRVNTNFEIKHLSKYMKQESSANTTIAHTEGDYEVEVTAPKKLTSASFYLKNDKVIKKSEPRMKVAVTRPQKQEESTAAPLNEDVQVVQEYLRSFYNSLLSLIHI
eukprot:TRINITY_DN4014_c0_g1_i3.p1 TRINITY_DN4014_c0_g1~~TRINITY_DN4014_c0_g1_i3.p1  ORF type:complete len:177 (-),score=28.84 TRINITY_DN4014_c0_g1_i3:60-590(-)